MLPLSYLPLLLPAAAVRGEPELLAGLVPGSDVALSAPQHVGCRAQGVIVGFLKRTMLCALRCFRISHAHAWWVSPRFCASPGWVEEVDVDCDVATSVASEVALKSLEALTNALHITQIA